MSGEARGKQLKQTTPWRRRIVLNVTITALRLDEILRYLGLIVDSDPDENSLQLELELDWVSIRHLRTYSNKRCYRLVMISPGTCDI